MLAAADSPVAEHPIGVQSMCQHGTGGRQRGIQLSERRELKEFVARKVQREDHCPGNFRILHRRRFRRRLHLTNLKSANHYSYDRHSTTTSILVGVGNKIRHHR